MKMSKITFVVVFAGAVIFSGELRAEEPSVFEAFKTFCVDTDIEKAAVSTRAASVGALSFKLPEHDIADEVAGLGGIQRNKAAWLAKLGGRQFEIYFSASDVPASQKERGIHSDDCEVIFRGDDARGVDDMRRWIAISDDYAIKVPGIGETSFEFEVIDGEHVPLPKTWRVDPSFSKSVIWEAETSQWRGTGLSLTRTRPLD